MDRVERIFRQGGAVLEGHFLLTSGRHSPVYWEKMRV
ncbi:MAG: orotate phosphoribosyltransferase, partial [Dehalococcoidia bacterium]|nr:orotate phosphoribosyltransferase [Dehalococcoidia bacterium]